MKQTIIIIGALIILTSYKTKDNCDEVFIRAYQKGITDGVKIGVDETVKAYEEKLKQYLLIPK